MGFVCVGSAHVTAGSSGGMMSTTGLSHEFPGEVSERNYTEGKELSLFLNVHMHSSTCSSCLANMLGI